VRHNKCQEIDDLSLKKMKIQEKERENDKYE
jgi:hypothetical protein